VGAGGEEGCSGGIARDLVRLCCVCFICPGRLQFVLCAGTVGQRRRRRRLDLGRDSSGPWLETTRAAPPPFCLPGGAPQFGAVTKAAGDRAEGAAGPVVLKRWRVTAGATTATASRPSSAASRCRAGGDGVFGIRSED